MELTDLITVVIASAASFIVLFLLTKLMGKRQVSQLSMFDYINGITIGSIAAEMATSLQSDFLKPLVAMIIYALFEILVSYLGCKSIRLRKFLNGKPLKLLDNSKIYYSNFKKAKLDVNEFLELCRGAGYFDISKIEAAYLEPNGKLSILPISSDRPATPADLNLNVKKEKPTIPVIIDGNILKENLKLTGNEETWLKKQLNSQSISQIADVFLAICDNNNKLSVYKKESN